MRPWRLGIVAVVASLLLTGTAPAALTVTSVDPKPGAALVDPGASVQIHTSIPFDAATVKPDAVRLLKPDGGAVPAVLTTDLGGVITMSSKAPLEPRTTYKVDVTASLRAKDGSRATPFTSTFTTGAAKARPGQDRFRFSATRIGERRGMTSVVVAPDGNLYVSDWAGRLVRYELDPETGLPRRSDRPETVFHNPAVRLLSLSLDPKQTGRDVVLWVTYDHHPASSTVPLGFTGVLSRFDIPPASDGAPARETKFITGFPHGAHAINGTAFGPDGRLYISQGSTTHVGTPGRDGPDWVETPLSGTILVADVRDPRFNGGRLPLDVRTSDPVRYDPTAADAPLKVHATGVRQAYDLCWHSNGNLYTCVNMNDTGDATPAGPGGVPSLKAVHADEPLVRVLAGKHYGHPSPPLGEFVLNGGNPTPDRDPWEIAAYPVGTRPGRRFDPSLLMFNLVPVGGQSADGCAEYTPAGPLHGRLLVCFYTSARTVHSFAFSETGDRVVDDAPLCDSDGKALRFNAPLDLAVHPKGWIYVIDFSDPRRGDSGREGAVWLLKPVAFDPD